MNEIIEFFKGLFAYKEWPPRWKCGYWSDFHGWLYIVSELMVWTAYFLIPLIIINYFYKKRTGIKFRRVYLLFATFILLCGSTHFLDALMFWVPMYRLNAVVRLATGVISLFTVYHLMHILPQVFSQKTNLELETEIAKRQEAEYKLEEANKGLEAFAYAASHDLQEPLRKIRTFTSLLNNSNENTFDTKSKDYVKKIVSASDRMNALINDILTLSTITENVEFTEVDTNKVITSAMEDLELKVQEKNAQVNIAPLPNVKGSDIYLTQLFTNLIGNALKFTQQQPVVTITGERVDGRVIINVADNGIGISEEHYNKIFESFQRLNSKQEYEGTGIGLAICKRIADIHNGRISVNSKVGEGTTFSVELPAA